MADVLTRRRIFTAMEEARNPDGFVEFHADEFPGYFVKMLATGGRDDADRKLWKHMINIAYLEPGAKKVHTHEAENVLFILEGEGVYHSDFDKTSPVKAGDLCLALGGEPHGFLNTGSKRLIYLAVEGPWNFEGMGAGPPGR